MLFRELLSDALEKKRADFGVFFERSHREREEFRMTLETLGRLSHHEITERLGSLPDVGGIPSDEIERLGNFAVPFGHSWQNHEQARHWAAEVLSDRTTFAADGSQIYAGKETSLPVAGIQIGWFENPHNAELPYEKNARFEILSPEDLLGGEADNLNPETRVGERRFHAEVEKAAEFLSKMKGWRERGERMPLAFFDGTILVSFSLPRTAIQESFIQAMVSLVRHSRETGVPIVGYVDRSFSRDILAMALAFEGEPRSESQSLYDSDILRGMLAGWGDRSCFCFSKRRGMSAFEDPATGRSHVGFTYLQTAADAAPVRLDIPSWVYEDGLLNEVIDVIRAECVIGVGYPYALEAADQTAVISVRDREVFLKALQDFAKREKLDFKISRKNESKGRRR